MDNYEIWYNMKNNSLTFPDFSTKIFTFPWLSPDYPENDTILPDFPVCINPDTIFLKAFFLYWTKEL